MTLTSIRRAPLRMMEPHQQQQDENAMPISSCSTQITASPSTLGRSGHARSPSKLPTLSDIAARLNRDRETSTPGTSPIKQLAGTINESPRPRLELTGRITASPKPPQLGDRKSPLLPQSPSKASDSKFVDQGLVCLSPKAPSSGACSPTKRMLTKGLPSLEEIRDRMSRKGLTPFSDETSPQLGAAPSSPKKPETGLSASPEIKQTAQVVPALSSVSAPGSASTARPTIAETKQPISSSSSTIAKPVLKVSISTNTIPKLNHPLPPTPGKAPLYPLQHEWTLFFDSRSAGPSTPGFAPDSAAAHAPPTPTLTTSSWEANLRTIGTYSTVNAFLGCFSKLHRPSQLDRHSSYHVFKDGIKPMWEDARNAEGGKWTITFRQRNPALVDRSWLWLALGLIGEEMDERDETCGAVCSVKPRGDRISLWVRDRKDVETVNRIGKNLVGLLELEKEPGVSLEFTSHTDRAEDAKQEGLFSVNNPIQQMARTPTLSTFGPTAGLPNADSTKLAAAAAAAAAAAKTNSPSMLMATSPTSPNGKGFPRSPLTASPNVDGPFGRLSGQTASTVNTANMFGRSPTNTTSSPNFGALGQSLGLGIGLVNSTSSPSASPNPNERKTGRNPFQQGLVGGAEGGALSWRSNRSTSPQHRSSANNNGGTLRLGPVAGASSAEGVEQRARSTSPFKA